MFESHLFTENEVAPVDRDEVHKGIFGQAKKFKKYQRAN